MVSFERADEAMAVGDLDGFVAHLSTAVRQATAAGDLRRASLACARLGEAYASGMGNRVAARPWFTRAVRLLADEEPCVEQGWAALAPMGCDVEDPAVLLERAHFALDLARRFGEVDLEVKALADGGLAKVYAGDLDDGMAMLDEAMALACGGAGSKNDAAAKSVCSFYTACSYTADFARAASWNDAFRRRGILGPSPGPQAFISSHCESVHSTLLCQIGRWGEAEEVLLRAHAAMEEAMPGATWHTPIALAELRLLQGRFDEAEVLLLGKDDHLQALLPSARLHLARGDHAVACACARRGLRLIAADRIRSATLLGVLVEAELGRGDCEAAAAASAELDERVGDLGLPVLAAEAARMRARLLVATGEVAAAIAALRAAFDQVGGLDLPMLLLSLHLDLARLLEGSHWSEALVEVRAARALVARLDVVVRPDDLELLRRFDPTEEPGRPGVGCRVATLERDGGWWTAGCGETQVRLRDTKGLRHLAVLVAQPGAERHALDLVDLVEGLSVDGIDRRKLGSAGSLSDASARSAYRRRITGLRDEIDDALDVEDDDRAARLQGELDAVVAELARSFGIGGRDRKVSSAGEKARLNVTRAIRAAIATIGDALPDAGSVLDRRIRTGSFCAYEPHPDDEVTWHVRSSAEASTVR